VAAFLTVIAIGAGFVLFLSVRETGAAPLTVRLSELADTDITPWCDDARHVCIAQPRAGEYVALYTIDTHEVFRSKGCTVPWRPEFDLSLVNGRGHGAFRSGCSGSTFDLAGRRLFGPAPRDLDRFRAEVEGDDLVIRANHLLEQTAAGR
jgi:Rieske Fe-S protein